MANVSSLPPHGPTAKERKYDRQLRLWGAEGQVALEDAHLLLINSGAGSVGVETLKNLVLPGIGQFTIHDSELVTEADLGVNFFLEKEDLGKYRAESCSRWLQELNPDVKGGFVTDPIEPWIEKENSLYPYTLIIIILPVAPRVVETLIDHANGSGVPVFYVNCIGFQSHFSLQVPPAFPIVDTHPDPTSTTDLRLLNSWPELASFMVEKTNGADQMDDEEHGHIPYVLILLRYLEIWKVEHDGKIPKTYKEKSEFREMVRQGARTNTAEGSEENFDEAVAAVLKSLNPPTASSAVREIFDAEECNDLKSESASFWIIASAVKAFHLNHGVLPLPGSLPDMKAKSADYIQLQNIYKSKARSDVEEVTKAVRQLEARLNKSTMIEPREIETFCKSAAFIKLIRGRPPHVARLGSPIRWADRAVTCANKLIDPESLIPIYITFLAYDAWIGASDSDCSNTTAHQKLEKMSADAQVGALTSYAKVIVDQLITEAAKSVDEEDYSTILAACRNAAHEIIRADGGELHNIAALVGGMVSQEAIKVITKQYVPIDNTCVFDGITSKTSVFRV